MDCWNGLRQKVAAQYLTGLAGTGLTIPLVPDWAVAVWHLFVVRSKTRNKLQKLLNQAGIGTLIHYPIPPHLQGAYADLGFGKGTFPIAERIHEAVLSLPIFPSMTAEQANQVVAACREAEGEAE